MHERAGPPREDAEDPIKTELESRIEAIPGRERVKGRYLIGERLGTGGMAVVYRAREVTSGREMALKQLVLAKGMKQYAESVALFEREFHTLAQLSHPRIIEVYDYGVGDDGPYYTMELLDGGDLRERSPMPWREACSLLYDVCSSLALIHSRRLVHRDVSPRNVRCTRDGRAKLIDFGAMVPMGLGGTIVGTPAFIAPEVVNRSQLDARTDLFSLGATLYYALAGRPPFAVRTISQLAQAWTTKPPPPSHFTEDVPEALDALVLSLLAIESTSRPRTAFEVMQQLAAMAELEHKEPVSVSRAYLSTPVMVARTEVMAQMERELVRSFGGRGRGVLILGEAGMGRSRMLDAAALAAKTLGATVLRASATSAKKDRFGVAQLLVEQLLDAEPDVALSAARDEGVLDSLLFYDDPTLGARTDRPRLKDLAAAGLDRLELQTALSQWLLRMTSHGPLALAVDDVHRIDEPSAALLASLASQAELHRLVVVASAEVGAEPTDRMAYDVLVRQSSAILLTPLDRNHAAQLFESVFGDVPNLAVVTRGIFGVARGNPRSMMELAQHLVDRAVVRYEGGSWTLPVRLDGADLPNSAAEAMQARLGALAPLSRWLGEAQALASHDAFTREDHARLSLGTDPREIDARLAELVAAQILVSDGRIYTLAHPGWKPALTAALADDEVRERHRTLAALYEGNIDLATVRHMLLGGLTTRGLDLLRVVVVRASPSASWEYAQMTMSDVAAIFERALVLAEGLGRPPREVNDLRRWLASFSVSTDDRHYWLVAPAWLEQLKRDSGYHFYLEDEQGGEPGARLMRAMQRAYEAYTSLPEAERVYRPDEAIRGLAQYVAVSIAIGSRTFDQALPNSLPSLLEPFAPLSPIVHAMWQNALATRENMCEGRPEQSSKRWAELYDRLGAIGGDDEKWVDLIRRAVAYGAGSAEAWMGKESATAWAERMDDDPLQRVNALLLRRVVRLQQGDWNAAERFRRQAEVLALQARARQMFTNLTAVELSAHTLARDLTGIRHTADRIDQLAARAPGWVPFQHVARGCFALVCGDFEEALAAYSQAYDLVAPAPHDPFPLHAAVFRAASGTMEALIGLERYGEARAKGEAHLALFGTLGIGVPRHEISRVLALAEAKLGEYSNAVARLEGVLSAQLDLGITGLHLGATYEALARVAIWAGDQERLSNYTRLTAREYRHGKGSPLGARYERLMDEARRIGIMTAPSLSDFESSRTTPTEHEGAASATAIVTGVMRGAEDSDERARRALRLICDARAASAGYLYLFSDSGVRLAATHGGQTAPDGLLGFVEAYLERELDSSDASTEIVDAADADDDAPLPMLLFTDGQGDTYAPSLLLGTARGEVHYAGIAMLRASARPEAGSRALALLDALGGHLIQRVETRGVRAG